MPCPSNANRRGFLSGEQTCDQWVRMLTDRFTPWEAAAEAGVDRSTISTLLKTARDGAITALTAARPVRGRDAKEVPETARVQGEIARLGMVFVEQADVLALLREKRLGVERADPIACRRARERSPSRPRR